MKSLLINVETYLELLSLLKCKLSVDVLNQINAEKEFDEFDEVKKLGSVPTVGVLDGTVRDGPSRNERDPEAPQGLVGAVAMGSNLDTADNENNVRKPGANDEQHSGADGESDSDEGSNDDVIDQGCPQTPDDEADLPAVLNKLQQMDEKVSRLDQKSHKLGTTVKDLETSLEFSQSEIDALKKENAALKKKLEAVEMEDRRTQFQTNLMEDKLDKIESVSKKKNLIFDGVPEVEGRREDVQKTLADLFDQLSITKGINFDTCYRIGSFERSRCRPILVSFERQSDRDLLYAKRMALKKTADYQRVWVNEDLGPISKRKRSLIRMISREAQLQGFDCKTGKYAIHIDKTKYDDTNIDELPQQLHLTQLKQVQIDQNTIAYQSEFAPFSNFFTCSVVIGNHVFFCVEQAFQFVRAKTMGKPLAATKIYLSRDVRFIKQVGNDLGTSETWEARKMDVMYESLKKKFEQNQDLRSLLLKTGHLQLVEATPDPFWGCGATLSSNILRRHKWTGQNKHGEILMVVRDELRDRRDRQLHTDSSNPKQD